MSETLMEAGDVHARPELLVVADTVARDKGIEREEVLEAMEMAIQKAARSKYGQEHDVRAEIDRNALAAYLRYNYVPAPASIYKGIGKLEPGCLVVQKLGDPARIERYWDLRRIARDGQANPLALTDADATDKAEALLRDAVGRPKAHAVSHLLEQVLQ